MKKLKGLLVLLLVVGLCLPVNVRADDEPELTYLTAPELPNPTVESIDDYPVPQARVTAYKGTENALMEEMETLIKNAILKQQTEVDLSTYGINCDKYGCLPYVVYYSPYFNDQIDVSFYYSPSTNTYVEAKIRNSMTLQQTKTYFSKIDQQLASIYDNINSSGGDYQKALEVHDYITSTFAYDTAFSTGNEMYMASGLLNNGIGVCNAYAYLYQYLMNHFDIECYVTKSTEMNHAWNIVKIDNQYYHIDCTWDDPVLGKNSDAYGQSRHTNFLVSDSGISATNHTGWDRKDLQCSSTKFDNMYWKNITSSIILNGDNAYYIDILSDEPSLVKRNISTGSETSLYSLGKWYMWENPNSYWNGNYSGLFENNNNLYMNTSNDIIKYSLSNNQATSIYKNTSANGYLYGISQSGADIKYVVKQSYLDANSPSVLKSVLTVKPTSISLSKSTISLNKNATTKLSYSLLPTNASTTVKWSTTNSSIATVDQSGNVKGIAYGTATIAAKTSNNKIATCKVTVQAVKISLTKTTITVPNVTYTGNPLKPTVTVKNGSTVLKNGTDYILTYKNNTNVGTASVVITGKGNYTGSVTKTFKISARKITPTVSVTYAKSTYTYNGKTQTPSLKSIIVKYGNKTLKNGTDYTYTKVSGKSIGKYGVKVTLKGNYSGSAYSTQAYSIIPTIRSTRLTSGKKLLTVNWNRDSQVTGYQIRYATNSKMTNAKTITIKGNSTVRRTISQLVSNKRYYVQVRSYKSTTYNGKATTVYSSWSTNKSIVVR